MSIANTSRLLFAILYTFCDRFSGVFPVLNVESQRGKPFLIYFKSICPFRLSCKYDANASIFKSFLYFEPSLCNFCNIFNLSAISVSNSVYIYIICLMCIYRA